MYVCIYPYTYASNNYVLAQGSRVSGLYVQALRVQRVNKQEADDKYTISQFIHHYAQLNM